MTIVVHGVHGIDGWILRARRFSTILRMLKWIYEGRTLDYGLGMPTSLK